MSSLGAVQTRGLDMLLEVTGFVLKKRLGAFWTVGLSYG